MKFYDEFSEKMGQEKMESLEKGIFVGLRQRDVLQTEIMNSAIISVESGSYDFIQAVFLLNLTVPSSLTEFKKLGGENFQVAKILSGLHSPSCLHLGVFSTNQKQRDLVKQLVAKLCDLGLEIQQESEKAHQLKTQAAEKHAEKPKEIPEKAVKQKQPVESAKQREEKVQIVELSDSDSEFNVKSKETKKKPNAKQQNAKQNDTLKSNQNAFAETSSSSNDEFVSKSIKKGSAPKQAISGQKKSTIKPDSESDDSDAEFAPKKPLSRAPAGKVVSGQKNADGNPAKSSQNGTSQAKKAQIETSSSDSDDDFTAKPTKQQQIEKKNINSADSNQPAKSQKQQIVKKSESETDSDDEFVAKETKESKKGFAKRK